MKYRIASCLLALMPSLAFADSYSFVSTNTMFLNSDKQHEAMVNQELNGQENQLEWSTNYYPSITIGVGQEYDDRFAETSVSFSQATMNGNSDMGSVDIDHDIFGVSTRYGIKFKKKYSSYIGGYVTYIKESAQTWLKNGSTYRDKAIDVSFGLLLGSGYQVTENLSVKSNLLLNTKKVDSYRKSHTVFFEMQYNF